MTHITFNMEDKSILPHLKQRFKMGLNMEKLRKVLKMLEQVEILPPEYRAHNLSGKYQGNWE